MELLILYKNIGSLSKENFNFYFGTTDDYDVDINIFNDMLEDYSLIATASYSASILIAPYLFYKYKKCKSYEFLNEFNNMIMKSDINIDDCFKFLKLNCLDEEDIKVLSKSVKKLKREYLK